MPVRVINDVIKVRDILFPYEIAQDIDVAIDFRIRRENVVVGDNDTLLRSHTFASLQTRA